MTNLLDERCGNCTHWREEAGGQFGSCQILFEIHKNYDTSVTMDYDHCESYSKAEESE